jgi:hypothetical protein
LGERDRNAKRICEIKKVEPTEKTQNSKEQNMSKQDAVEKVSQSAIDTDARINALLDQAHQIHVMHPDDVHKIQKLREDIEQIECHPDLTEAQKNKLALISIYTGCYHEYVHIQKQINQLDSELHHTEPTVHNSIYFSQITLRLRELCSKGAKKEAEIHEALVSLKNLRQQPVD